MFLSACICNIFLFVIWQSPISFPDRLALVSSYLRRIQYCNFFILVDKLIVFFFFKILQQIKDPRCWWW